jgi:hypothetical protein
MAFLIILAMLQLVVLVLILWAVSELLPARGRSPEEAIRSIEYQTLRSMLDVVDDPEDRW